MDILIFAADLRGQGKTLDKFHAFSKISSLSSFMLIVVHFVLKRTLDLMCKTVIEICYGNIT